MCITHHCCFRALPCSWAGICISLLQGHVLYLSRKVELVFQCGYQSMWSWGFGCSCFCSSSKPLFLSSHLSPCPSPFFRRYLLLLIPEPFDNSAESVLLSLASLPPAEAPAISDVLSQLLLFICFPALRICCCWPWLSSHSCVWCFLKSYQWGSINICEWVKGVCV